MIRLNVVVCPACSASLDVSLKVDKDLIEERHENGFKTAYLTCRVCGFTEIRLNFREQYEYWYEQDVLQLGETFCRINSVPCFDRETIEIIGQIFYHMCVYYDYDIKNYLKKDDFYLANKFSAKWKEAVHHVKEACCEKPAEIISRLAKCDILKKE